MVSIVTPTIEKQFQIKGVCPSSLSIWIRFESYAVVPDEYNPLELLHLQNRFAD